MSTTEGYVYLTDRAAFMIISGGVNIYPQECENLLVTHPKVADAAVFGVPNEEMGEEVKAVVQLMPAFAPAAEMEAELIAFCRDHLAHQKCPRSIDFEAELPRLPTGKLYKALAARTLLEGASEPHPVNTDAEVRLLKPLCWGAAARKASRAPIAFQTRARPPR